METGYVLLLLYIFIIALYGHHICPLSGSLSIHESPDVNWKKLPESESIKWWGVMGEI